MIEIVLIIALLTALVLLMVRLSNLKEELEIEKRNLQEQKIKTSKLYYDKQLLLKENRQLAQYQHLLQAEQTAAIIIKDAKNKALALEEAALQQAARIKAQTKELNEKARTAIMAYEKEAKEMLAVARQQIGKDQTES